MSKSDWVVCPHCGEEIRSDAKACRHCGSDDNTGWSEATYLDGVDLPEAGDYEDGLSAEGFRKAPKSKSQMLIGVVAMTLIALFATWLFRQVLMR